jgi:hypothetical protein
MTSPRLLSSPLRFALRKWDDFFFRPESPLPIALFRAAYGVCVVATLLLLRPDWLAWFGTNAWVRLQTMRSIEPRPRLSFFALFPQTGPHADLYINLLFWIALCSSAMLSAGFLTRFNSILTFLCINSIQQRNLFITQGGDTFLRVTGFFLVFAPAGAAFSIDRILCIRRGKPDPATIPESPWAQRMIQIELSLLYLCAAYWKLKGQVWVHGSALFTIYHLDAMKRFPLPVWFYHPMVLKIGSWATIALEFSLGILIWIRKARYFILALGLALHLWLEYSLNIPMFQWDVLTAYLLFIDPDDLPGIARALRHFQHRGQLAQPQRAV